MKPPSFSTVDLSVYCTKIQKKQETRTFCGKVALLFFLLFIITGLILLPHFNLISFKPSSKASVGTSKGYLKAALRIHQSVNKSVDPCDDFYEHVCGNYIAKTPIPDHLSVYNDAYRLVEEASRNMKVLMDSPEKSTSSAINKMKSIYHACLQEENYIAKAPKVILATIKKVGPWPMLERDSNWDPLSFSLQKLLQTARPYASRESMSGFPNFPFFKFELVRDPRNLTRRILSFDQATLLVKTENYKNPEKFENEKNATVKFMVDRISQFSKDVGIEVNPQLEKEVEEIFVLEKELAQIVKLNEERRDNNKLYNLCSFKEFNQELKEIMNFDLKKYALATTHPIAHSVINDDNVKIQITDLEFPKKLAAILKKTNPKTVTNYVMYRSVFDSFGMFLGQKYRDIDFEFQKSTAGVKEAEPFWKSCNGFAEEMRHAYGALYARNHFDEESKASINVMITNMKEAFTEMIQEATWMDDETKSKAKEKVQKVVPQIGYSKHAFDDDKLDTHYAKLEITDSDVFITIHSKLKQWNEAKEMEEFMKPLDRTIFQSHAAIVDAYFRQTANMIGFPAGILQFPFFDKDQPQAMNYGLIGYIIGHELTHGMDDWGKDYDKEGNLKKWWSDDTLKKFKEKAQCIIDQYGDVEVPNTGGMHLNGKQTTGENIADNGGFRESYRAYQKYISKNGPEPTLPGIEATPEQLFFYNFPVCTVLRPEYLTFQLLSDPHAPMKYRANVVLQNSPEFAKAFNCPLGSPMNPEKKCVVW